MKSLTESLKDFFYKKQYITDGGASGHMAHPIDFGNFTVNDLKQLIKDIFYGKIEDVTLDHFIRKYKYLESSIYICPKKIKDETNKLIIYNLEYERS